MLRFAELTAEHIRRGFAQRNHFLGGVSTIGLSTYMRTPGEIIGAWPGGILAAIRICPGRPIQAKTRRSR